MRSETFKNYDGKVLVRINKKTAHRMYKEGNIIYACPVFSNPWLMGVNAIDWMITMSDEEKENYWNHMLNLIAFYQCSAELGHYLKFYVEGETVK